MKTYTINKYIVNIKYYLKFLLDTSIFSYVYKF